MKSTFKAYPQVFLKKFNINMLASDTGARKAQMMRPGYAIEYDAIVPTQLWPTLETKKLKTCIQLDKLTEHQDMKKLQPKDYGWY